MVPEIILNPAGRLLIHEFSSLPLMSWQMTSSTSPSSTSGSILFGIFMGISERAYLPLLISLSNQKEFCCTIADISKQNRDFSHDRLPSDHRC